MLYNRGGKVAGCHHRTRAMNPDYRPTANVEDAYVQRHASAIALLQSIQGKLMDMPAPDGDVQINWAHVGSVAHVDEQLKEILQFLGG